MSSSQFSNVSVILLKNPSPNVALDPYTTSLSTLSYSAGLPTYIPVLAHNLQPDFLIRLFLSYFAAPPSPSTSQDHHVAPEFPFGGLILSSQRAVAALSAALSSPPAIQQRQKDPAKWGLRAAGLRLRLYTVGPATAKAATEVVEKDFPKCEVLGGHRAGSGEILARVILGEDGEETGEGYNDWEGAYSASNSEGAAASRPVENSADSKVNGQGLSQSSSTGEFLQTEQNKKKKPLLFLAGATHRDIIPRTLQSDSLPASRRIPVTETIVYDSVQREDFPFELAQLFSSYATTSTSTSTSTLTATTRQPTDAAAVIAGPPPSDPSPNSNADINLYAAPNTDSSTNTPTIPKIRIITFFSPLRTSIETVFTQLNWLESPLTSGNLNNSDQTSPTFNPNTNSKTTNTTTTTKSTLRPNLKQLRRRQLENIPTPSSTSSSSSPSNPHTNSIPTFIACIGPTTQIGIRETVGYEADIVAKKPSPEGLRLAIQAWVDGKGWER